MAKLKIGEFNAVYEKELFFLETNGWCNVCGAVEAAGAFSEFYNKHGKFVEEFFNWIGVEIEDLWEGQKAAFMFALEYLGYLQ